MEETEGLEKGILMVRIHIHQRDKSNVLKFHFGYPFDGG